MALVELYFAVSAAGSGNATSWANRAALFDGSGNWSTYLTGFNFSTDSCRARIATGNYTCNQALTTGLFSNAPNTGHQLFLHGCNNSDGGLLTPPDPEWVSAEPEWNTSTLPVIASTGNHSTNAISYAHMRLLKITSSGRPGTVVTNANPHIGIDWCYIENSQSNTSAAGVQVGAGVSNSIIKCTANTWAYCVIPSGQFGLLFNCRLVGGLAGSGSGTRCAVTHASSSIGMYGCTIIGCYDGIIPPTSSTTRPQMMQHSTFVGGANANKAIILNGTAAQSVSQHVTHNHISGWVYGIDINTNSFGWISSNRLRDNTSGNITNAGENPTDLDNYTTDADDEEFWDATNGDYRIAPSAVIWGKNYGAGDGPISGGIGVKDATGGESGGPALKMTGPGVQYIRIAVNAASTTLKIKVKRQTSSYTLGTRPSATIIDKDGFANISGNQETKTGSASCDDAFEELTFTSFTPDSAGWIYLRLRNASAASTGVCWFDTSSVT